MTVNKQTITAYKKGQLAYKAGCTIDQYPDLDSRNIEEWKDGFLEEESKARVKIFQNDMKFYPDATGGI